MLSDLSITSISFLDDSIIGVLPGMAFHSSEKRCRLFCLLLPFGDIHENTKYTLGWVVALPQISPDRGLTKTTGALTTTTVELKVLAPFRSFALTGSTKISGNRNPRAPPPPQPDTSSSVVHLPRLPVTSLFDVNEIEQHHTVSACLPRD